MAKREKPVKTVAINISEEEKEKWSDILKSYYRNLGKLTESQIETKINNVFIDCSNGRPNAPNSLESRISKKTGYKSKLLSNSIVREEYKQKQTEERKIKLSINEDIRKFGNLVEALSLEEREWWSFRLETYYDEFEFNKSSDIVLLNQLLVEELLQRRIFFRQLKTNAEVDAITSKVLTESNKRIQDLQTKLGITRDQRLGILDKIDGNVASLSATLEEKIKEYSEQEIKDLESEIFYSKIKEQKPPINILPTEEEIEAIRKGDKDSLFKKEEIDRSEMEVEQPSIKQEDISTTLPEIDGASL